MGKATQDLRKEHETILYVLKILDKMVETNKSESEVINQYYEEVVYFLKIFADKCHHGKEENYLFNELVNRGLQKDSGPVGQMLQEHVQGRTYIAQMSRSLENKDINEFISAANLYNELLRAHIEKENKVLLVMADRLIDEKDQNLMFEQFENHEENVIGHGLHEKLHSMIDSWAKVFDDE